MSVNTSPIFQNQGNQIPTFLTAANNAVDGTGTIKTLLTADADGTRVDGVQVRIAQAAPAANSAMICRVFLSDASGANWECIGSVALSAVTRSHTQEEAKGEIIFSTPRHLRSGQLIGITQSIYAGVQDRTAWLPFGGDF